MGKIIQGYTDLATTYPAIAMEWNPTKNGDLKPRDINESSIKKVWWTCSVCGYEWSATINSRVRGQGCPYCAGKKAEKEE